MVGRTSVGGRIGLRADLGPDDLRAMRVLCRATRRPDSPRPVEPCITPNRARGYVDEWRPHAGAETASFVEEGRPVRTSRSRSRRARRVPLARERHRRAHGRCVGRNGLGVRRPVRSVLGRSERGRADRDEDRRVPDRAHVRRHDLPARHDDRRAAERRRCVVVRGRGRRRRVAARALRSVARDDRLVPRASRARRRPFVRIGDRRALWDAERRNAEYPPGTELTGCVLPRLALGLTRSGSLVGLFGSSVQT